MAKKEGNETPLMQQYYATKAKYPDAILLYRMGDFYETFGADAITTSRRSFLMAAITALFSDIAFAQGAVV